MPAAQDPRTVLAALYGASKYYGGQTVFEDVTIELRAASRCALIGRNGAGKTTLLRLLAGAEQPDSGRVFVREGVELSVLSQETEFSAGEDVRSFSDRAFASLDRMEERLGQLEKQGLDDPETYASWEALHETFERRGGYARTSRRAAVLHALGFAGREGELVSHLSGGEKTRLGLARLLMGQPDLLLLDEPTNHLDMEMRDWLSAHLSRYAGATLIISHDRAFLDAACQQTAEVAGGRLLYSEGNPSAHRHARAEQERIEMLTRRNQQKEQARLQAAADRMKGWAGQNEKLHRRATAMYRRLERFEEGMLEDAEPEQRSTRFSFNCGPTGDIVLQADHLTRSFGEHALFRDVSLTIRSGDRIALLGPNGAGKTTFLRTLLGDAPSDDPCGHTRTGSRVRVGYYDQELRDIDPERTLLEELIRLCGETEAHDLLGRFMFPYAAQFKQIRNLSGGEKARLALLKLTLGEYSFLVMDEPTNHLDVEMIEALEAALAAFEGTLFIVSHDRRFVRNVTDTVWELNGGHLEKYAGGIDYWFGKREELRAEATSAPEAPPRAAARAAERRSGPSRWQLERNLEQLEEEIAGLEAELAAVTARLEDPLSLDGTELLEASELHAALDAQLLGKLADWEETAEQLEESSRLR